jgi:hypothetical protein
MQYCMYLLPKLASDQSLSLICPKKHCTTLLSVCCYFLLRREISTLGSRSSLLKAMISLCQGTTGIRTSYHPVLLQFFFCCYLLCRIRLSICPPLLSNIHVITDILFFSHSSLCCYYYLLLTQFLCSFQEVLAN